MYSLLYTLREESGNQNFKIKTTIAWHNVQFVVFYYSLQAGNKLEKSLCSSLLRASVRRCSMNWNKIWMPLLGTCEWLGLNIGFWVSMAVVVIIVILMNVVFWSMKPKK